MARYKVLKSIAHNFVHSFVSVMNYQRNDYTMCHLSRRAKLTGSRELVVDVLKRTAGPIELLTVPILAAIDGYCRDFGRLTTTGGGALDMVSAAELRVRVSLEREIGKKTSRLHARVLGTMRLVDDRGREHVGRASETYECGPLR
jgi:hypothetical protein